MYSTIVRFRAETSRQKALTAPESPRYWSCGECKRCVIPWMAAPSSVACANTALARARGGDGPTLIECKTYRWHGHSEHDKAFYRSDEELAMWKSRDPIPTFTTYLRARHVLDDEKLKETEARVKAEIDEALEFAMNAADPDPSEAVTDLYA